MLQEIKEKLTVSSDLARGAQHERQEVKGAQRMRNAVDNQVLASTEEDTLKSFS